MFIEDTRIPVTVDGENYMYIRPKMSYAQREKAEDAVRELSATQEGMQEVKVTVGAYRIALLHINLLGWEGPAFQGVKFTPQNVDRLDPDEPLLDKVMEEIATRNPLGGKKAGATEPDPLPDNGSDGSEPSQAPSPTASESGSGMSTSYSPNGSIGPTMSLEDVTRTS